MGRRKYAPVNRHQDGNRSSIGDDVVTGAVNTVMRAFQAEVAMEITQGFDHKDTLRMLFDDDLAAKLHAVRRFVIPQSWTADYRLQEGLTLGTNWKTSLLPTPSEGVAQLNFSRMERLFTAIDTIRVLRFKYSKVTHLLRWFNRHATPAAVRNYWPSALALTPGSAFARDNVDAPSRYQAPPGIGQLLPLLRETAGTVAAMQMIPSGYKGRDRSEVWLTFSQGEAITEDSVAIPLDHVVVNL